MAVGDVPWLLREEYDIEVASTRLVYVPDGTVDAHEAGSSEFTGYLGDLSNRLDIEPEQGLPTRPEPDPNTTSRIELSLETRCGSYLFNQLCPDWERD